jgi:hypothetical protein
MSMEIRTTPFGFPLRPGQVPLPVPRPPQATPVSFGGRGVPVVVRNLDSDRFEGSSGLAGPFGTLAKLRRDPGQVSNLVYKLRVDSPADAMTLRLLGEELAKGKKGTEPLRRFFQDGLLQFLASTDREIADRGLHILRGLVLHCAKNDGDAPLVFERRSSNTWITNNVFIRDRSNKIPDSLAKRLAQMVREVSLDERAGVLDSSLADHLKEATSGLPKPSPAELKLLSGSLAAGKSPRQARAILASALPQMSVPEEREAVWAHMASQYREQKKSASYLVAPTMPKTASRMEKLLNGLPAKYVDEAKAVANATRHVTPDRLSATFSKLKSAIGSKPSAAKKESPANPDSVDSQRQQPRPARPSPSSPPRPAYSSTRHRKTCSTARTR